MDMTRRYRPDEPCGKDKENLFMPRATINIDERCINVKEIGIFILTYENKYLLYNVSEELKKIQSKGRTNL